MVSPARHVFGTVTASVLVPVSGIGFCKAFSTWLDAALAGGLSRCTPFILLYPRQHATQATPSTTPPQEYARIGSVQVAEVRHEHQVVQQ